MRAHGTATPRSTYQPLAGKSLLLVEDHAATAGMMGEVLMEAGYEVRWLSTAREAVQTLRHRRFAPRSDERAGRAPAIIAASTGKDARFRGHLLMLNQSWSN